MKVTQIRQTIVAIPQRRAYRSSWRRSGHGTTALQSVLVEIDTDEGVTGIGESPVVWAGQADVTRALIAGIAHLVVGADPLETDIIRRRLYAETGMAHLGTQGISWALSGVDTALWDIVGRVAGQPLHRLWGGAWRDRSAFYADLVPGDPEQMAEDAVAWVERGFRTMYLKVGFAPDIDEARVRAVRAAVGRRPAHPHRRQRGVVARARAAHAAAARRATASSTPSNRCRPAIRPSWPACARAPRCRSWRTSRVSRSRARSP